MVTTYLAPGIERSTLVKGGLKKGLKREDVKFSWPLLYQRTYHSEFFCRYRSGIQGRKG